MSIGSTSRGSSSREWFLRRVLWLAAFVNLGGATLFAFPASAPGRLLGLPADAPVVYRAMVALFILLFGAAYAWLATQPAINRPFVAFGAIGKASAFALIAILGVAGVVPLTAVGAMAGDLVLAALFAYGLGGGGAA